MALTATTSFTKKAFRDHRHQPSSWSFVLSRLFSPYSHYLSPITNTRHALPAPALMTQPCSPTSSASISAQSFPFFSLPLTESDSSPLLQSCCAARSAPTVTPGAQNNFRFHSGLSKHRPCLKSALFPVLIFP